MNKKKRTAAKQPYYYEKSVTPLSFLYKNREKKINLQTNTATTNNNKCD